MTLIGSCTYLGGFGHYAGVTTSPVAPEEKVKPEEPLQRDQISVGMPWLGYDKAPPAGDDTWWLMRRYSACVLAYAVTVGPIFAGTRTAVIRNAEGNVSTTPTGIGAQVIESPEEKRRKLLDDVFEDAWPDVLCGLESLNFGRWTQEVIWDRKFGVTAPVRFKSFLPREVELQRDKFNDFAGYKLGQIERDARYAFHAVCQPHFDPIFGAPRAANAREAWHRAVQCHLNGDAIEKKASGIQMAIGIMTGMRFKDTDGTVVTSAESALRVKNAATSGASWVYSLLPFDNDSVKANPELAKVPSMKIDPFDWGDTGPSLLAAIARLSRLDVEIIRAWNRPEREAMEGQHGTKAEAGTHGAIGTLDSEKVHSDFLRQFNRQVVNPFLVTNFGPDAADTIYFKAAPLSDPQQEFKQAIATALLNSPSGGPQMQANIDGRRLLKETELPLVPESAVPVVAALPEEEPPEEEEDEEDESLALSADVLALNCGTGAGGFKAGNECAAGDGSSEVEAGINSNRGFANDKAADEFGRNSFSVNEEPDSESLSSYQNRGYEDVNEKLRSGNAAGIENDVAAVDAAISNSVLTENATVFRGQALEENQLAELQQLAKSQLSFSDPAFLSTSLVPEVAEEFTGGAKVSAIIEIEVKKGSNALYMNRATGFSYKQYPGTEMEVLLPRGSRLTVRSVEPDARKKGRFIVRMSAA